MEAIEPLEKTKKPVSDSQKKATKKYRDNNRDKVNAQRKKYYEERKVNDPDFMEYKRLKAKQYYQNKKQVLENI